MKKTIKNWILQVFCKNKTQKLKALVTYPCYLYEKQGINWQTFLYFKSK